MQKGENDEKQKRKSCFRGYDVHLGGNHWKQKLQQMFFQEKPKKFISGFLNCRTHTKRKKGDFALEEWESLFSLCLVKKRETM